MEASRNTGNNDNDGSYTHGGDNTAKTGSIRIDENIDAGKRR
jgi:hypothetical protein